MWSGALYKSMEFTGDGIANLSMDDRFTNGEHGDRGQEQRMGSSRWMRKAEAYMKEHSKKPYTIYEADEDAQYDEVITINLSEVRPDGRIPTPSGKCKDHRRGRGDGADQDRPGCHRLLYKRAHGGHEESGGDP